MRRLGSLLCCVLLVGLLAGEYGRVCAASSLTLGLVTGPTSGAIAAAQTRVLAERLSLRLDMPVTVRLFDSETRLHEWLTRFREVDVAWLATDFLAGRPAGEVLPLAAVEKRSGVVGKTLLVARQGLDAAFIAQLRSALLALADDPEDGAMLGQMGISRFVAAPALPSVRGAVPPPPVVDTMAAETPQPPPPVGQPPVTLEADQLDLQRDPEIYRARGGVVLQQGETRLTADELVWQTATRDAAAEGSIHLSDAGGEVEGSSLRLNLGNGRGTIEEGRMFLRERNFHLEGEEIERLGETSFRVSRGRFTTCDGDIPDWRFSAAEVDVNVGHFATARDVWFEVHNQPLIYLPYLVFPVKAERESGFLLPRAGYSSRKGAQLSLAWYQVIDRNLDATVYLDYFSTLGLGKGLEYRYDIDGDSQGKALFYHVSGFDNTPDSYAFAWRHEGVLPGKVRLAADIEYVNKRSFFEDFGEASQDYTQDQAISTLLLQRNWEKFNLTGHGRYIRDLQRGIDPVSESRQELGADLPFYRLGGLPVFADTQVRLTNFEFSKGDDGQRLTLKQGLAGVIKPGSWLEFTPEVILHGRTYRTDTSDNNDAAPEFAALLSTRLLRVYPFDAWGIDRVQHSIEPQVGYRYIAEGKRDLPFFDRFDQIGPLNLFEYALVNRLTTRSLDSEGNPTYLERLNLRLSQSYDVRTERDDSLVDPEPFSDLRTELVIRPTEQTLVEFDLLNSVYDDLHFNRFVAGVGVDDGKGNLLRLDYHYRRQDAVFQGVEYVRGELATSRFDPIHLNVQERYELGGGQNLESLLGIEYRARCWSIFLTLRERPGEQEVMLGFALSGLGQVGGYGSTLRPLEE